MARLAVITVFLLTCLLSPVYTGTWISRGPCPEGREVGDVWQLDDICAEERCTKTGVVGISCGLFSINIGNRNCHLEYNNEDYYPDCCAPVIKCEEEEESDGDD
ncbi:uncharacterized protein LOC106075001 isoform X1 [Biomphalaria glabrata]|uniref:Uncharacterized protein LOC106075001 isoform X1 n=1 Tax=Biomphalaria glabrata TaxID=6526 RepID=A0A9W3AG91_BIOGL|nr:uncharacterized protein LOC106075001 isoform X1 [Biomphalaria glabrata]